MFDTVLGVVTHVDCILDFNVAEDAIRLSQAIFATLTPRLALTHDHLLIV